MVLSKSVQPWYRVDITLKLRTAPATTKTLKLISRTCRAETATYFPIVKDLSGCGVHMGQNGMPAFDSGSIVLDDSQGSFGYERRFSDLLERYTLSEQPVIIYACATKIADTSPNADFVRIWSGVAKSAARSMGESPTLTITAEASAIDQRYLTKVITADMAPAGYTVPSQSLGKALPLVFGAAKTIPIYSIQESQTDRRDGLYAIATEFADQFQVSSLSNLLFVKCGDGIYRQVRFPGVDPTDNYSDPAYASPTNYPTSWGLTEFLVTFDTMIPSIITGASWYCKGQNDAGITPVGDIVFNLYEIESGSSRINIDAPVRSTKIAKSDYLTQVRGASGFFVDAWFDEPYIMGGKSIDGTSAQKRVALGIVLTNYSGSSSTDFTSGIVRWNTTYYTRATDSGQVSAQSSYQPYCWLKRATFSTTHATKDREGKAFLQIALTGRSGAGLTPPLTDLEMAMTLATGLTDDSGGTLTGSAYKCLNRPDWAAKLCSYRYNGSSWADPSTFDWTTYGSLYTLTRSGNFQRSFSGITSGATTLEAFLTQLAKEMCAYIVPLNAGKLALWPWGYPCTTSMVLTDDTFNVTNFEVLDASSVINEVIISYADDYLNNLTQWAASGQYANKTGAVTFNKDTDAYWYWLAANSVTLYGAKPLEDTNFAMVPDAATAQTFAECMFRTHDHPWHIVKGEMPMFKAQSLEMMNVCEILSTQLPAFFGASAKAPLPANSGTSVDLWRKQRVKRATRYRGQLLGKTPKMSNSSAPMMELVFRILDVHKNDPT